MSNLREREQQQQPQNVILNMRVTANSTQGHRKYMEDCYKIRFQRETSQNCLKHKDTNNNKTNPHSTTTQSDQSDILFSYFAIFDGHGGKDASQYCKEKLYWKIIESDDFWSDNDSRILSAIRNGFVKCHMDMWNELPGWPKTAAGLPSTSGTTATVLFIKKSKAYVGHVGDSGLLIGYTKTPTNQMNSADVSWFGKKLTRDHKPEDPIELKRIQSCGGSVMSKSGINRVVWNRPVFNSSSQINLNLKKSQSNSNLTPYEVNYQKNQKDVPTERVPFLAVARSLGDLWSYNVNHDEFIVSPVPDVFSFDLDPRVHKCLILATDGLWNVLKSSETVELVRQTDKETENLISKSMSAGSGKQNSSKSVQPFVNPSQRLVNTAIQRCCEKMIRADNTTCITIMLDQPVDLLTGDEFDFNSTQDILNKTNFEKLLKQNKTFDNYSRRCNDSDEFDDEYDELEDEEEDEEFDEDDEEGQDGNSKYKFQKTFSGQMLTSSTISEFNTPLDNDKRSRSLISLRRRHWSATSSNRNHESNRSSSMTSTKTNNRNNQFINVDDRNRRAQSNNKNEDFFNKTTTGVLNSEKMNPNSFQPIYNTANSNRANQRNISNNGLHLKQNNSNNLNHQMKSNLNVSSISAINKFSKNLRKSFNDLYTSTSNKFGSNQAQVSSKNTNKNQQQHQQQQQPTVQQQDESSKENNNKPNLNDKQKELAQTISSRYTKRLKRFKNRLIKTKNNILNRKRKLFNESSSSSPGTVGFKRKSISSPNLKNLKITNQYMNEKKTDVLNCTSATTITNQSFVNNMRSKFNNLKRNQSSKFNQEHLNSTTISTKLSATSLSNKNLDHFEQTPTKRAKFY